MKDSAIEKNFLQACSCYNTGMVDPQNDVPLLT